ncbi:MAG: GYF domain-containing protein [Phycisphaerales bacterium]
MSAQHQDPAWFFEENDTPQGPVPQAALPGFVAVGRINAETLVWTAGMADWLPARNVPFFAGLFAPAVSQTPPAPPPPQPMPAHQPMQAPQPPQPMAVQPAQPAQPQAVALPFGTPPHATGPAVPAPPAYPGMVHAPATPGTDGLAIASLVLGCFTCSIGLCLGLIGIPFAIAGIVCGAKSATKGNVRTAGIVTSIVGLVLTVLLGIVGIIMSLSSNSSMFP